MEDDQGYPDFGSAFPSSAPASSNHASWHPAFRPNTNEPSQPAPIKTQTEIEDNDGADAWGLEEDAKAEGEHNDDAGFDAWDNEPESEKVNEDDEFDAWGMDDDARTEGSADAREESERDIASYKRHGSISVERVFGVQDDEPQYHEKSRRGSSYYANAEGPISKAESLTDVDEEAPIFAGPSTHLQKTREHQPEAPIVVQENLQGVEQRDHAIAAEAQEDNHPETNYEHQGDLTDMDKAIDENVEAPLMEDEAPLPTPGVMSRNATMNPMDAIDAEEPQPVEEVSEPEPSKVSIDRSFTTNFTENPEAESQIQENHVPSEDWPAVGDDKTFGELLDQNDQAPNTSEPNGWPNSEAEDAFGEELSANRDLPAEESVESSLKPHNDQSQWPETDGDDGFGELLSTQSRTPAQEILHEQASSPPRADDWPSAGDDDAFGEIAKDHSIQQQADATHEISFDTELDDDLLPDEEGKEDDLAAAWQAALDDDDLLADDDDLLPPSSLPDEDGLLEDDAVDPSNFFADDGDSNFLQDEPVPAAPKAPQQEQQQKRYQPSNTSQQNPYVPAGPAVTNPVHGRSAGTPDTGLFDLYSPPRVISQASQPQADRPGVHNAQSFSDKAKGGYQSPYDLPMEVVKPRRRPQPQQPAQAAVAPPRSSSFPVPVTPQMGSTQGAPPPSLAPSAMANQSPPTANQATSRSVPPGAPAASTKPAAKSSPSGDSGFFADLPMTVKPRARVSGNFIPQPAATPPLGGAPPVQPLQRPGQPTAVSTPPQQNTAFGLGLTQPERLPLLPDQPTTTPSQIARAPPSNRYSPAPVAAPSSGASRYSPTPAATPGQAKARYPSGSAAAPPHAFAPRTSSPLAYQTDKPQPPLPHEVARSMTTSPPALGATTQQSFGFSPDRRVSTAKYDPASQPINGLQSPPQASPQRPIRPRTQSPGQAIKQPRLAMTSAEPRPISAGHQGDAPKRPALPHRRQHSRDLTFMAPQDERSQDPLERWKGHPIFKWSAGGAVLSSFPKQTPYYAAGHGIPTVKCSPGDIHLQDASTFIPIDDRNAKFPGPLPARSKGKKKEIVTWLNGKVEDLERQTERVILDFNISPELRKRADEKLVLWKIFKIFVENDGALESNPKIEEEVRKILLPHLDQMEQTTEVQTPGGSAVQVEPVDRATVIQLRQALFEGQRERAVWLAEEKKLWGHAMLIASTMGPDTWKQIVQSFVRSQVKTVGSDARSLATVYQIFAGNSEDCVDELVPPSARAGFQMVSKDSGTTSGNPLEGLDQWRETLALVASNRTNNDGASLVSLGKLLAGYGRVEAAHTCFLFARTFVKHSGPDDTESNFTLLGANHLSNDESFGNELDPILMTEIYEWATSLSAPSTAVPYIPHLQAWKLVHAQILASHGWKSKAQTYCEHITSAYTSTTRPSGYYHPTFTQAVTDLGAFLSQAPQDGKAGFFSKPAMNKVSSGAASWFTKFVAGDDERDGATAGQVGGNPGNAGPFGGVAGETAPISRQQSMTNLYNPMMNETPYGGAGTPMSGAGPYAPSTAPSRYAPSNYAPQATAPLGQPAAPTYTPQAAASVNQTGASKYAPQGTATPSAQPITSSPSFSLNAPQPTGSPVAAAEPAKRYSLEQKSLLPSGYQPPARTASSQSRYAPSPASQGKPATSRANSEYAPSQASLSRRGSVQYPGSHASYEPQHIQAEEMPSYGYQPPQPPISQVEEEEIGAPDTESTIINNQYAAPEESNEDPEDGGYAPPSSSYNPESGGYELYSNSYEPSSSSYEPPSTGYVPYQPEPDNEDNEEEAPKPKKKSFMDDEDDDAEELARRAAALKKAQADREADDAFRKAAEADAARDGKGGDAGDKKKGSWLGGWWGKKDPNNLSAAAPAGPIRAKLGEENSFYYDEQLKKWVNKKGGADAATPAAATPPPPRGPSRAASGAMGPPSGPPSRVASAAGIPPSAAAAIGGSMKPPTSAGPPSRTSTPASQDAGVPPFPPFGAAPGISRGETPSGPPSRPATGMSNASSLDDLLGGPPGPGRKSGGTAKKKKGGRYVDVMAK